MLIKIFFLKITIDSLLKIFEDTVKNWNNIEDYYYIKDLYLSSKERCFISFNVFWNDISIK